MPPPCRMGESPSDNRPPPGQTAAGADGHVGSRPMPDPTARTAASPRRAVASRERPRHGVGCRPRPTGPRGARTLAAEPGRGVRRRRCWPAGCSSTAPGSASPCRSSTAGRSGTLPLPGRSPRSGYAGRPTGVPLEVFFPGFPLLLAGCTLVGIGYVVAGAASFGRRGRASPWSRWRRLGDLDDPGGVRRPGGAPARAAPRRCSSPPYTEALFLAFAIPAWLAARRGRWAMAGSAVRRRLHRAGHRVCSSRSRWSWSS